VRKASHSSTRTHNSRLVLNAIYDGGPISRADLSRATDLTAPTVSDVVSDLMEQGLVEEVGYGPSTGGKPPILLSVVDDSRHLIGLDLARGDFRGAVINLRGEIRHRVNLSLGDRSRDAALALTYELVDGLVEGTDSPLLGIGIGAPGLVDAVNGVVQRAVNVNWRDVPLRDLLQGRYNLPVYVANDCQVAALAEYSFGNDEDVRDLVVVNVGYGVGAGIILNGQLLHGNPSGAGEIGHVVVEPGGERCQCGNYGCLETVTSRRTIIRRARAIARSDPQSQLHQFSPSPETITLETICQALQAGDESVQRMIYKVGQSLGIAAANLVGVLGSCRILFAGSVTCFGPFLLDAVQEEVMKRALSPLAKNTEVGLVSLGSDIVLLGASALLLPNELGLF
jgi:N-acetylglucosamine repressor